MKIIGASKVAGRLGTSGLCSWMQRHSRQQGDSMHFIFLSAIGPRDEGERMLAPGQIGNDLKR